MTPSTGVGCLRMPDECRSIHNNHGGIKHPRDLLWQCLTVGPIAHASFYSLCCTRRTEFWAKGRLKML